MEKSKKDQSRLKPGDIISEEQYIKIKEEELSREEIIEKITEKQYREFKDSSFPPMMSDEEFDKRKHGLKKPLSGPRRKFPSIDELRNAGPYAASGIKDPVNWLERLKEEDWDRLLRHADCTSDLRLPVNVLYAHKLWVSAG